MGSGFKIEVLHPNGYEGVEPLDLPKSREWETYVVGLKVKKNMLRTANPSRYAMSGDCVGIVPEDGLGDTLELLTCRQLHDIDLYLLYLCRKRTIRC